MLMKIKQTIFFLLFFLIHGCMENDTEGKKETGKQIIVPEASQENSSVDMESPVGQKVPITSRENNPVIVETPPKESIPISSQQGIVSSQTVQSDKHFLSGKTELLSIKTGTPIFGSDYILGDIHNDFSATIMEKEIVDNCKRFLKSINKEVILFELVESKYKQELNDYINQFVKGIINFEEIDFGKPQISNDFAIIKIRIHPDKIQAYLYMEKDEEKNWLLSGIEIDLRKEKDEEVKGKWMPSVSSSLFE